jgi:hypothetical protein
VWVSCGPQLSVATYVEAGMRALKVIPILAASTFALAGLSSAAAHLHHKLCAIPRGWQLAAQNRYVVVDMERGQRYPAYDRCDLIVGRWRTMIAAGSEQVTGPVYGLKLAGRFVAYETTYRWPLWVWDARTGRNNHSPPAPGDMVRAFLLSPNGVAARLTTYFLEGPAGRSARMALEVMTLHTWSRPALDEPLGSLANLQLYDCAAGCPPNTTIVAWTDNGQQQYAKVS